MTQLTDTLQTDDDCEARNLKIFINWIIYRRMKFDREEGRRVNEDIYKELLEDAKLSLISIEKRIEKVEFQVKKVQIQFALYSELGNFFKEEQEEAQKKESEYIPILVKYKLEQKKYLALYQLLSKKFTLKVE